MTNEQLAVRWAIFRTSVSTVAKALKISDADALGLQLKCAQEVATYLEAAARGELPVNP